MKAQDLKNSILQMAMEGKLVPQDPNDEPASVLIEKIKEEKELLIKEKKIKRNKKESVIFRKNNQDFYEKIGKKEPICINEEIPFEIPNSWEWIRLNFISQLNGGFPFKSSEFKEEGIRIIRISDFNENGFKNDRIVFYDENSELDKYCLEKNDILMAMTGGTVGKTYFVKNLNEKMYVNQRVATIRIINSINKKYIYSILKSYYIKNIIHKNKNSTNDNISMNTISSFLIPLPPLNEQEKIVKKLDEIIPLIENYDNLELNLEELNINFPKKIKDSILQEAIQGKLVHQNLSDEPSSVLLERIKEKKERLIKEKKIKKNKNESYIFKENNHFYEKIGNEKPICIDDEIPFEIPCHWEWTRIKNISEFVTKGTTPRGGKSAYKSQGIKFLRVENIGKNGELLLNNIQYVSEDTHYNFLKRSILKENDLLISIAGALGRTAIVPQNALPLNTNQAVSFVRWYDTELIFVPYIEKAINSPELQKLLLKQSKITAIPNLTLEIIRECLVPIPPLEEQKRIVNKIEKLFLSIDGTG